MRLRSDGRVLDHVATPGKRLLVISPHADDAELGCGGYMFRTAEVSGAVLNLVVAVGDVRFAHLGRVVTRAERMAELERSMAVLRAESRVLLTEHDRYLDIMPLADLVTALEVTISGFRPTEILMPLPSSHQDHEAVYRASVAACRPSSLTGSVQLIAAYEYSATSWGAGSAAAAATAAHPARRSVPGVRRTLVRRQ